MLWKKVMQGLSAGRVQSVATRLVVERERERMRFVAAAYWDIDGTFDPGDVRSAGSSRVDGRRVARAATSATTAALNGGHPRARRGRRADARDRPRRRRVRGALGRGEAVHPPPGGAVHDVDPAAGGEPQAAVLVADHDARRAAAVRERLHHLHAHRLDDAVGVGARPRRARRPRSCTAPSIVPAAPRRYERKVKNAQEAHEAIRPAGRRVPHARRGAASSRATSMPLYELIWKRTVASQMADARGQTVSVRLGATASDGRDAEFAASGTVITFRGFLAAYEEGRDDEAPNGDDRAPAAALAGRRARRAGRARARRPRDHAAGPLHRGVAGEGAGGARASAGRRRTRRSWARSSTAATCSRRARRSCRRCSRSRSRSCSRSTSAPGRLRLHRAHGGRPRPDRRRATRTGSTGCSRFYFGATDERGRACMRS